MQPLQTPAPAELSSHRNPRATPVQSPYNTNLLMAGYDEDTGPALYWCDYLATLHQMNICGTGYGAWRGSVFGAG